MKQNDKQMKKQESTFMKTIFGGIGSTCGTVLTHPIDISKIRMQLSGELGKKTANYSSIPRTIYLIYTNEGLKSIYKGLNQSIIREFFNGSIRLGLYEPVKNWYGETDPTQSPWYLKLASGGTAGLISATICTPLDLIKVRMQAWEGKSKSIFWHYQQPFIENGIKGYFRGLVPTVQRGFLVNCAQIPSYDIIKHTIMNKQYMKDGVLLQFVSSVGAGIVCSIVSAPIDLIKTRMMNAKDPKEYLGVIDCFIKTTQKEGFLSLYKGFNAQWMRIGPLTITQFLVWEKLRNLYGIKAI